MKADIRLLADRVFDQLPVHPAPGITWLQLITKVHCSHTQLKRAFQYIRRQGKAGKTQFNLVCDPAGQRKLYRYRLIDGVKLLDPECTDWTRNRIHDFYERGLTIAGVIESGVEDTRANTIVGKMIRVIYRHFNRSREEAEQLQHTFNFDHHNQ